MFVGTKTDACKMEFFFFFFFFFFYVLICFKFFKFIFRYEGIAKMITSSFLPTAAAAAAAAAVVVVHCLLTCIHCESIHYRLWTSKVGIVRHG